MNLPAGMGPPADRQVSRAEAPAEDWVGGGSPRMQDPTCPLDGSGALQPGQPPQTLQKGGVVGVRRQMAGLPFQVGHVGPGR